jgi:ABC-type multidrug transport system fused ATPase/permease subunit
MNKIVEIFKQFKFELMWIYAFMLLTELSNLATPFLLGKAIDGLLLGTWHWSVLLGVSYFLCVFFNYKRMVYDTKVYTKIYNNIVFRFLKKKNLSTSVKVARTDMANEIVHVLEGYVHYYIATIVTIIGSIGFIYSENWKVGVLVSMAALLIVTAGMVFYKKLQQSIRIRNDHNEKKAISLEIGHDCSVSFFKRQRRLNIYDSTVQGKNWFLIGIIKNIFLFASVIMLVLTATDVTIGSIITVYSYVNNFLISLLSVPVAIEMYTRLSDVLKRIH